MERIWKVAEEMPDEWRSHFPEIHPVVLQILWNRGLRTQEEIDRFLSPDWSRDTHTPLLFTGMREAVERIFVALEGGQMITVHGDYDADGVCGSVVLMSTLRDMMRSSAGHSGPAYESKLSIFLPHREKDGYGLSIKTVEHLHEHEKTRLLITVDCGISNREAIAHAKELGIDTIVCDHHQMPAALPLEAILLHPLVPGEVYPNKKLCGTAVAYKLACQLVSEARTRGLALPEGYEKWLLDLVAIATVTDVMPLQGENRVLEKFGLVVLNKTKRLGLKALLRVAGLEGKPLTTWSIGFQIGPRINAAGRMDHANAAFELLMCEDPLEVPKLADALNASNLARQKASDALFFEAKKQIGLAEDRRILFATGDDWPVGIAGLVAGKLVQEYGLPVFVLCKQQDETFVGSGRSIHGFDVTAAMKKASAHLVRFGGHPQACGLSLTGEANAKAFQKIMEDEARLYFETHDRTPVLSLDAVVPPSRVDWELLEALSSLEPYGEGHPSPLFRSPPLTIMGIETMGIDRKHLRLTVREHDHPFFIKCVGFRLGEWVQKLRIGDTIEIAYEAGVNEWNGNREVQVKLVDLHKSTFQEFL